ncbi:NAD kinase [Mesonia sp. HuA40]|uniref:NAD kinase n=1 Tax=Mesonia sp. HuA40 TaxID=2602761 RepID=UPI0011C872C5|nr:NAD kinase [Mesonia sp. HuA40]TXK73260.1 NAD kinase [Mesonia sp. HuA40]
MKVALYGQFYHKNSGKYIRELLDELSNLDIEVRIEEEFLKIINQNKSVAKQYTQFKTFKQLDDSYDLFFSIGGDGTILRSVHFVKALDIPIVGINTGRLGFLATIQKEEIKAMILALKQKEYTISKRDLLSVATYPDNQSLSSMNFALNEVAISRKNSTSMITVESWMDDKYLNAYWADGLIISTPTGSTGYSLSCGGPIITPETKAISITPIAPHNLNVRPLIIPDDKELKLKVSSRENQFLISLDSRLTTLNNDTEIHLKKADFQIGIVLLNENSFIKTLRQKLLWGEDKRNLKQ